jgi:hypothetical protein
MIKMDRTKAGTVIFGFCMVLITALSSAKADDWNNRTVMTFDAPVEVPGVGAQILPAGIYVFRLVDNGGDRNIVQISNQAEDHVFTTILAIPNYRLRATGKTVMTFKERGEGQPEAIRAWFYPGKEWGQEFVYPKARALELSKIVHEPVLATPVDLPAPAEALKVAPIVAVKPTGEEVAVTEVVQAPPVETANNAPAPAEPTAAVLPQTASHLPFVGLVGLLSLAMCFGFLIFSKRIA